MRSPLLSDASRLLEVRSGARDIDPQDIDPQDIGPQEAAHQHKPPRRERPTG